MFFPMVDETDVYEQQGKQKDDINSLAEYINQVLLGHRDNTPEDEDDDQAHYYHARNAHRFIVSAFEVRPVFSAPTIEFKKAPQYGVSVVQPTVTVSYDITAPPPELYSIS